MATKKQRKKFLSRFSPLALLLAVALLTVGFFAGSLTLSVIQKKDAFQLAGEKEFIIHVGTPFTYTEAGYSLRAFGKDETDLVVVSHSDAFTRQADGTYLLNTTEEGVFGIFYTAPQSSKYNEIRRVRTFRVVNPEGGEG